MRFVENDIVIGKSQCRYEAVQKSKSLRIVILFLIALSLHLNYQVEMGWVFQRELSHLQVIFLVSCCGQDMTGLLVFCRNCGRACFAGKVVVSSLQYVASVGQAIVQHGCHLGVPEYRAPLFATQPGNVALDDSRHHCLRFSRGQVRSGGQLQLALHWEGSMRFGLLGAVVAMVAGFSEPAHSETLSVSVTRGLMKDQPYTIIYPDVLKATTGTGDDLLTLDYPGAPLQCVATLKPGIAAMTADEALANFDKAAVEADWRKYFANFTVTAQSVGKLRNVPALRYTGDTGKTDKGNQSLVIRAEAVDEGRRYAMECLVGVDVAAEAQPLIEFLIANFSTRSDGECCIDPSKSE